MGVYHDLFCNCDILFLFYGKECLAKRRNYGTIRKIYWTRDSFEEDAKENNHKISVFTSAARCDSMDLL